MTAARDQSQEAVRYGEDMFSSLKKTTPDYSFQPRLQDEAYNHLQGHASGGVVLAGTPGSGKTNMAIVLAERWLRDHGGRVLVLSHGQTILRQQFYDRMAEAPRSASYTALGTPTQNLEAQIHIALPHYFQKRKKGSYSLIVIDEAHHFTDADMVKDILSANPLAKLLFLTGSPSPFIKEKKYPLVSMTVSELLDFGILTDPFIELVQTNVSLRISDYNEDEDLKKKISFTEAQTHEAMDRTLNLLLERLVDRVTSKLRDPEKYAGTVWSAVRENKLGKALLSLDLGKTMVICHDVEQAKQVQGYFRTRGVNALLSTCKTDPDSLEITRFKADSSFKILIVVNRAILGFDMPELENVLDLSMSHSPDRIFQAMCRVVRRGPNSEKKIYLKVTTKEMVALTYVVMSFVVGLSLPQFYNTYDGTWKARGVPVLKEAKEKLDRLKPLPKPGEKKTKNRSESVTLDMPRLCTFIDLKHVDGDIAQSFAYTTFTEVKNRLNGVEANKTWDENFEAYVAASKQQKE